MVKAYSLDELRRIFRNAAGNNCKKLFEKRENGIRFIFNRQSFNKIGCDKSINNSVVRGFTVIEHFKVAANIKELFDNSEVVAQWNKKKKARNETYYLCRYKINEEVFAWMRVTTWGKDEGYIDMYLSKDGE
jgi:hypothetical protein